MHRLVGRVAILALVLAVAGGLAWNAGVRPGAHISHAQPVCEDEDGGTCLMPADRTEEEVAEDEDKPQDYPVAQDEDEEGVRGAAEDEAFPPMSAHTVPSEADEEDTTRGASALAPAGPSDIRFGTTTTSSIQLRWVNRDPSATIAYFYRLKDEKTYRRADFKAGSTSVKLSPVSAGQRWYMYLQACKGTVCSDPSDEYSTVPDPNATAQVVTSYDNCNRSRSRDFFAPNLSVTKTVTTNCPGSTKRFDQWTIGACQNSTSIVCSLQTPGAYGITSIEARYVSGGTAGYDWRVLVLIYDQTDVRYTAGGKSVHATARMTAEEKDRATQAVTDFLKTDVPALSSGYQVPRYEIRYPGRLTSVSSVNLKDCGPVYPKIGDIRTMGQADSSFDAIIVIWDGSGTDDSGAKVNIQNCGLADDMGRNQTFSTIPMDFIPASSNPRVAAQRNALKHEFGHSLLFYYNAKGLTHSMGGGDNHITYDKATLSYVNCSGKRPYDLRDETETAKIPWSIYNNQTGFTHDYYSGKTVLAMNSVCVGIDLNAWRTGGPVTHP